MSHQPQPCTVEFCPDDALLFVAGGKALCRAHATERLSPAGVEAALVSARPPGRLAAVPTPTGSRRVSVSLTPEEGRMLAELSVAIDDNTQAVLARAVRALYEEMLSVVEGR